VKQVRHGISRHTHLLALAQQALDRAVRLPGQADDDAVDVLRTMIAPSSRR